jgi:hypothetical protein
MASRVFENHVRVGMLASTGRKHSRPEAAVLDLLDDAVEQPSGEGATHVRIKAGLPTPLKARRGRLARARAPRRRTFRAPRRPDATILPPARDVSPLR